MHETRELTRNVGAHESFVTPDRSIGHENDWKIVGLTLRFDRHEGERGFVARNIQTRPRDSLETEQLLDAPELAHVSVLLEVDEHRNRRGCSAFRGSTRRSQLVQSLARSRALLELVGEADRAQRVAAGRRDGAIERVAEARDHGPLWSQRSPLAVKAAALGLPPVPSPEVTVRRPFRITASSRNESRPRLRGSSSRRRRSCRWRPVATWRRRSNRRDSQRRRLKNKRNQRTL